MNSDLFLPNLSPIGIDCYHTKLFKLLFYIPDIIFYVSDAHPHNIPQKYCYAFSKLELEKRLPIHKHVCRAYLHSSYIVFKIAECRYECRYDHLRYLWKIFNLQNSYDIYQIIDHEIYLVFFIKLDIYKIYDHAFNKQKAIFCYNNIELFWLLGGYTQNVVADLIFDKIIKISDNTELIQFRIR